MSAKINYPHRDALKIIEEHRVDHKLISKYLSKEVSFYKQHSVTAQCPVFEDEQIIDFENSSVLLFKIISLLNKKENNNNSKTIPSLFKIYKAKPQQIAYEKKLNLRECFISSVHVYKNTQPIYRYKNIIVLEGGIKHTNINFKREGDSLILEIKSLPGQMWTKTCDSLVIEQYFNGEQLDKAYEIHFKNDAHVLYYQDVLKKLIS